MKRILTFLCTLLCFSALTRAQVDIEAEFFSLPDSITTAYLDSMKVNVATPNNYWMVGVYGGASFQYGWFNPDRLVQWQMQYPVYGFSVVRHYSMFGMFPNMGFEAGLQMNYEGYEFKENKETGYRAVESGAVACKIQVPEAFILSHFHLDMGSYFKIIAKVGIYGGYRWKITRELAEDFVGYEEYEKYVHEFRDYDRRLSYGVQGGLGMGIMVNPFEFHLMVQGKWGWSSFWKPDYVSPYYYRFAYPMDAAVTFGLYYQLTPRFGHSRSQLKKLARKMVAPQEEQ